MFPSSLLNDIGITLAGATIAIIILLVFHVTRILGAVREAISGIYRSPTFIILTLGLVAFLSLIFNAFGLIEEHLNNIYLFIYSITIATYTVVAITYAVTESQAEISDPQPPLGWIGSVSIGAPGTLIGEFIQVMGIFQVSKLLIAGIGFGQWNIELSFLNSLLMNVIAIALAASAAVSVTVRWLKLSGDWDNVMEEIGIGLNPDENEESLSR